MSATRDGAPAREPARAPDRVLERDIGAVLVPEVRVPGTIASRDAVRPSNDYLRRFPPAGVIVFGRTPQGAGDPTALLAAVRATLAEAGEPRCFAACDLEQGAGLHFADATRLPPALALAAHDEVGHAARSAGALTALEARERGIELVLAPVVDVNTRRSNPIIAVRSFGAEPERAARHATAFLEGLHAGGAGGSAKHFPGHGDTEQDSHRELALVARSRAELERIELAPFRSAIAAGVDTVMVSHLDVPALTGEPGLAATLSARAIDVLRRELGFGGVVLSDALNMHALHGVERIHARALAAGCDGLLCPADPELAAEELLDAVETGRLPRARLAEAAARMRALRAALEARRATPPVAGAAPRLARWFGAGGGRGARGSGGSDGSGGPVGSGSGRGAEPAREVFGAPATRAAWARRLAGEALVVAPTPWPWRLGSACEVLAPSPSGAGPEAREAIHALRRATVDPTGTRHALVPVLAEVRAFEGRYGLGDDELGALAAKVADLRALGWRVAVAWFGSPQTLPAGAWGHPDWPLVLAFAPTPPMVAAVADFLAGRVTPLGSLPGAAR